MKVVKESGDQSVGCHRMSRWAAMLIQNIRWQSRKSRPLGVLGKIHVLRRVGREPHEDSGTRCLGGAAGAPCPGARQGAPPDVGDKLPRPGLPPPQGSTCVVVVTMLGCHGQRGPRSRTLPGHTRRLHLPAAGALGGERNGPRQDSRKTREQEAVCAGGAGTNQRECA